MKSRLCAALLLALPWAAAVAQDDKVTLITGTVVDGVKVTSYDVRELKYTKGGSNETVPNDQVAAVELGKFNDVYRRGLRDPDMMLTVAREQLEAKSMLLAQLGFSRCAKLYFDQGDAGKAVSALEEMQKAMPEAGTVPELYRQKFEYYMGQGKGGAANAAQLAKKYQSDAVGGAWPASFVTEAEFFGALAERVGGLAPKDFQSKLRAVVAKAMGNNVSLVNRANVQLAHSLRETKDVDGARKIYEDLANRDGVDQNSRAGALLGLGQIALDAGGSQDAYRQALLLFLRVRLETRECWNSLQAEALYHAILAAEKWRGTDFQYVIARCRRILSDEFSGTEWAQQAKNR